MSADVSSREARLAAKQKIDAELTKARTALVELRAERDRIAIALRKGELIRRFDVKLQLSLGLSAMRQRLMSFSYALPRRLAGQSEHAIGQIIDVEVRSVLSDIASWPDRLCKPDWDEGIDADLMPAPEVAGNGSKDADASARHERTNSRRRQKYAALKEG